MRAHSWALLILVLALVVDLLAFGGLARVPEIGPICRESASREAPIAWTYMTVGSAAATLPGVDAVAEALALNAFGGAFDTIRAQPGAAMDLIETPNYGYVHSLVKACWWGAPVLLLLWIVLFLRRTPDVHLSRR
jgi:hypothetical protein